MSAMDSELQKKKKKNRKFDSDWLIMTSLLKRCFACSVKRQSNLMASQKDVEILTSLLCVCLSNCLLHLNKKLVDQKGFIKNK